MTCSFKYLLVATLTITVMGWCKVCSAQVECNGVITGTVNDNVVCTGDCILDGATVSGNVECSTKTLLAKGNSMITGGVQLSGAITRTELGDVTVLGAVEVTTAQSLVELVINQPANLGSVIVINTPANVFVAGQLSSLDFVDSGNVLQSIDISHYIGDGRKWNHSAGWF